MGKHLRFLSQQHVREEACSARRSVGRRKAANLNHGPCIHVYGGGFIVGDSFPCQEVECIFRHLNVIWYVENKDNETVSLQNA